MGMQPNAFQFLRHCRDSLLCRCASKGQQRHTVVHVTDDRHRDDVIIVMMIEFVMQGGRMAAQYDSESKGERSLAFKPVGPFHMSPRCTADLFHAVQKAQSADIPSLLALICSFSSSTARHSALQCIACVSTARESWLCRLCSTR